MRSTPSYRHPKTSKAVLARQRVCRPLLATLEDPQHPTTQDPATHPTALALDDLLRGLAPWLRHSITELVRRDETVFALQAQLTRARHQRDTTLRALTHDLGQLRVTIESQYKDPEIEHLGFETPTPRSPQPLLRVATRVAESLAHPDLASLLGEAWYVHPFDPATHHDELATRAETLRRLLHQIDALNRDLDQARIRRHQALEDHDILVREARQIVDSVAILARLAILGPPAPQPPSPQAPHRQDPSNHRPHRPTATRPPARGAGRFPEPPRPPSHPQPTRPAPPPGTVDHPKPRRQCEAASPSGEPQQGLITKPGQAWPPWEKVAFHPPNPAGVVDQSQGKRGRPGLESHLAFGNPEGVVDQSPGQAKRRPGKGCQSILQTPQGL